jgi:hypothetical protein
MRKKMTNERQADQRGSASFWACCRLWLICVGRMLYAVGGEVVNATSGNRMQGMRCDKRDCDRVWFVSSKSLEEEEKD